MPWDKANPQTVYYFGGTSFIERLTGVNWRGWVFRADRNATLKRIGYRQAAVKPTAVVNVAVAELSEANQIIAIVHQRQFTTEEMPSGDSQVDIWDNAPNRTRLKAGTKYAVLMSMGGAITVCATSNALASGSALNDDIGQWGTLAGVISTSISDTLNKYPLSTGGIASITTSTPLSNTVGNWGQLIEVEADSQAPKVDWTVDDYCEYSDLNRIEINTQELANYLTGLQYSIPALTHVTVRDISHIDFVSSINRIENNIETIKNNFIQPVGYQNAKTWAVGIGFTYLDAIRLETNLKLLYDLFLVAKNNLRYCGTFACGEEGVIY